MTPGPRTKLKSSAQRAIRAKVCDTYPELEPYIDTIVPKKAQLDVIKLPDRVTLYALASTPLFFQHMDDALIPHLRLVHKYPDLFHRVRVDRGAIRFVLSGAALMVPGLTSDGGRLPGQDKDETGRYSKQEELAKDTVVLVEGEGKEVACGIGPLTMSTKEMKDLKKGIAIEAPHTLGDGLWRMSLD